MGDERFDLYEGLQELGAGSFPRKCNSCGREYRDAREWLEHTIPVPRGSGLKSGMGEHEAVVVELFRNCRCGSTLMEPFCDRRDTSESGERRRQVFDRVVETLVANGLTRDEARLEVLGALRGRGGGKLAALLRQLPGSS